MLREKHQSVASRMHPNWGPHLQPRYVPWLGIELVTFALQNDAKSTEPPPSWLFSMSGLDNFYWSVLEFSAFFFSSVISILWVRSSTEYCIIFSSKISIWFFFYAYVSAKNSYLSAHFKSIQFYLMEYSNKSCLKAMLLQRQHLNHLRVAICWLFPWDLGIVLWFFVLVIWGCILDILIMLWNSESS